jgi:DNA-binding beta-propeller fold protein YncE
LGRVFKFPRGVTGEKTAEELATMTLTGFHFPTDIDVDEEGGYIFVTDSGGVYRYNLSGQLQNKITESLDQPNGVSVDPGRS